MRKWKVKISNLITVYLSVILAISILGSGFILQESNIQDVPTPLLILITFLFVLISSLKIFIPLFVIGCIVAICINVKRVSAEKNVEDEQEISEGSSDFPDAVTQVEQIKGETGSEVHVGRGSELDVLYRQRTGTSLSDKDCDDCAQLNPWDEPKPGLFSFLKRKDCDVDDVEEYYRSRGIDLRDKER